jgi:hypothetical protein
MVVFTFGIIIVLSLFFLFQEKNSISIRGFFFLFCFIFFGISGLIQYKMDFELAPLYQDLRPNDFLNGNMVIIASMILYDFVYKIVYKMKDGSKEFINNQRIFAKPTIVLVFLGIYVSLMLYLNNFSVTNILLRGGDGTRIRLSQQAALLLYSKGYIISSLTCLFMLSENKRIVISILFVLLFVFFNFPTSMTRLSILSLYLPVMIILIPTLAKKHFLFYGMFLGGFFVLFPILGLARYSQSSFMGYIDTIAYSFYGSFESLDFDTYKTCLFVISNNIITYGQQLLGCILFWYPRSLWPNKPIGSGHLIAREYDLGLGDFSNISMNFLGEGYINFGYVGIVFFVIIFAYFSVKLDKRFWIKYNGDVNNPFSVYYFSTIGHVFFFLRGDMLSGTAYYVGMIVFIYITEKCCFRKEYNAIENLETK